MENQSWDLSCLCNLTPEQIAQLATSLSTIISLHTDTDIVFVLSSLFSSMGNTFGLIARQRRFREDFCCPKPDSSEQEQDDQNDFE